VSDLISEATPNSTHLPPPWPSACDECGSDKLVWDNESEEVACASCGKVLDVGDQKPEAAHLLARKPVILRRLLLDLCELYAERKARHEQVEDEYAPKIQKLESTLKGITGPTCNGCGIVLPIKIGPGRRPKYCSSCKKIAQAKSSKRSREKLRREDPEGWRQKRRRWKHAARARRRQMQAAGKPGDELGGRPLTTAELRQLGISQIPHSG